MNKAIYTFFLLILQGTIYSYPSMGAPKPNVQAKKVIASISMPSSFQADFVYAHIQAKSTGDTQEECQIKGKIWVKDSKYRLVLDDQVMVSNGETIWSYVSSMQEVQIYNEKPVTADKDRTSFSPIDLLQLYKQKRFVPIALHTTTIDQKERYVVELIALDKNSDVKHINLVIDPTTHQINSMQVLEEDGTVHNFSIVNLTIARKLKDTYFEFQMPEGPVEVVDLR